MSHSRYKFIVVYMLYGVCVQTSVSILCDIRWSRPDGACSIIHHPTRHTSHTGFVCLFVCLFVWLDSLIWAWASLFRRGFMVTHIRHTTVSRTPLDEGPARRRDFYLKTHNNHKRQTSMPPVGFECYINDASEITGKNVESVTVCFKVVSLHGSRRTEELRKTGFPKRNF
jgi:hypothetical protein